MTVKNQVKMLLLCLGIGLSLNAAKAQPPADDKRKIQDCVQAARKSGKYPGRCVGMVADPCMGSLRNLDDAGEQEKACAARELKIWTARLEKSLANVKRAFPDMGDTVSQSQKSWGASNGVLCPVVEKLDPGMVLGGTEYCRLQETAARALLLEWMELAVSEH